MSKEYLEVKDLQANFIRCFNELLTKTDKDILVVNISRVMAQEMVNLYEKYSTINPSKAIECLDKVNNYLNDVYDYKEVKEEVRKDIDTIKQALLEFKRLDLLLRLPSEQSSSHFTYKDKNLVCMQLTKYSKLMNAFLEYEKAQEQEKVLEIMFEKNVNVFQLRLCNTLDEYNARPKEERLTQEEFDLLKRWEYV